MVRDLPISAPAAAGTARRVPQGSNARLADPRAGLRLRTLLHLSPCTGLPFGTAPAHTAGLVIPGIVSRDATSGRALSLTLARTQTQAVSLTPALPPALTPGERNVAAWLAPRLVGAPRVGLATAFIFNKDEMPRASNPKPNPNPNPDPDPDPNPNPIREPEQDAMPGRPATTSKAVDAGDSVTRASCGMLKFCYSVGLLALTRTRT